MRPETVKPFEIETNSKLQPLPSTPWASEASHMIVRTVEQVRRAFRIVAGFTLLLAGVVMIVTPGPGWLVIFLGLSLLAAEFIWARRLMERMKREGGRVRDAVWSIGKGAPPTSAASDSSQAEAQKTE
jgi:drug/metabolite transporter (DMT)-like permease